MLDQMPGQDTDVAGYRIESLLGRGGMGTVFRARHLDSGRIVALKVLSNGQGTDPKLGERFRGEGRAQAALEHPNVVTVYEAGESDSGLFLAMRLIEGPPLSELIRERAVDAKRVVHLLDQVADALDNAHAAGLVHRDVKPHNVLVGEDDHAYLADFGLTRFGPQAGLTASGALVGSVAYLAPEVVRGGEATPASDRYAFAAMAFECLTGSVVFPRTSDVAVLFAQANDPPPRIGLRRPELGDGLDDLFSRALAKDPAERPGSAREFVSAIRRELVADGTIALPAPPLTGAPALVDDAPTDPGVPRVRLAPPRPSRRRGVALAALAALAGAAVVAGAWALFADEESQPARAAPADRSGLQYIGADLNGSPGRTLDCLGRSPRPLSPACTVVQADVPGEKVVVPQDGTIRRWSVRDARGEVRLAVLRPRDGGAFQIALSSTESVGSADVQSFDTDIEVERGDLVGLIPTRGSGIGVRTDTRGATTQRWIPPVPGLGRPADRGPGTGFDDEVLLRVGILPGGKRRATPQLTGAAARRAPAGQVVRQVRISVAGRPSRLALVRIGQRFALDQITGGRRVARIDVAGLLPGAQIVVFNAAVWSPDQTGLDLSFINEGSARVVQTGFIASSVGFIPF